MNEQAVKRIIETGAFSPDELHELVDILASKLSQEEFLMLDAMLEGTDFELFEEVRAKSETMRHDLFGPK